jgi:hypothetical protein
VNVWLTSASYLKSQKTFHCSTVVCVWTVFCMEVYLLLAIKWVECNHFYNFCRFHLNATYVSTKCLSNIPFICSVFMHFSRRLRKLLNVFVYIWTVQFFTFYVYRFINVVFWYLFCELSIHVVRLLVQDNYWNPCTIRDNVDEKSMFFTPKICRNTISSRFGNHTCLCAV